MSGRADRWIKWTTVVCVGLLALIAGTVSYLHMHMLVALHGQPGWVAALTPLSVDGMIVAASTTLLADSRSGSSGGLLPWALLVAGSVASLAANVAVAEPSLTGRVIAAWPSFALIAAYELLMRQVRHGAVRVRALQGRPLGAQPRNREVPKSVKSSVGELSPDAGQRRKGFAGLDLQREAWQWAQANRTEDGSLPSGKKIAHQYDRHERWGRVVKKSGLVGELNP
jgi:Protein of unknown function (DUF2637)